MSDTLSESARWLPAQPSGFAADCLFLHTHRPLQLVCRHWESLSAYIWAQPYILPRSLCYARTHRARGALLAERARTPPRPQAAAQLQNAGVAAVHPGLGSAAGGNSAEVRASCRHAGLSTLIIPQSACSPCVRAAQPTCMLIQLQ